MAIEDVEEEEAAPTATAAHPHVSYEDVDEGGDKA
jgi:hypothetical protein